VRPTITSTKWPAAGGVVVRLADLAPAERQVVLALIAAAHAAKASSALGATSQTAPQRSVPTHSNKRHSK
jgi:hypothetical protein